MGRGIAAEGSGGGVCADPSTIESSFDGPPPHELHSQGGASMIVGIGSDLCNIERIQKSLDRWGIRFLNRVFTETERRKAASRPHTTAGTLAKRFAAKEAFSKAVGTGFKRVVHMK